MIVYMLFKIWTSDNINVVKKRRRKQQQQITEPRSLTNNKIEQTMNKNIFKKITRFGNFDYNFLPLKTTLTCP